MKLANLSTSAPSASFRSGRGLYRAIMLQSPCGQFSSGNSGLVMPISLRYASAENCSSVGFPFFQPNLPTAGLPVVRLVTTATFPATEGA